MFSPRAPVVLLSTASLCLAALLLCTGADARAITDLSDPNTCTVCIKRAPNYVPHTGMQWTKDGKVCVQKTFSRRDDWLLEDCGGARASTAELETLTDVPSCEMCHHNSSLVETWHKSWTKEDGSQCTSAQFVPKARS